MLQCMLIYFVTSQGILQILKRSCVILLPIFKLNCRGKKMILKTISIIKKWS